MILDSPIISGSLTQQAGQTAEIPRYTAVSSSFLAASASFDARIDSIESTTASFSPRINALESFTASADATYVNVSGDSMSGNLTITGSLVVTDRITAQEFHTEYVSSSVVFQSGSTKFGDSVDDVHSFTGSVEIDGNVIASNLEGVFSSSAQLTGSLGNYYIVSGTITQTTWDNIENKPAGIVSGSSQVISLLPIGVVSGSSQITYSSISSIPSGIVSGAAQVTESLDLRYRLVGDDITFAELTFKPTLISGSSQLDGTTIQNLSGSFSGSFSGSYRGDGSQLTGLAAGAKFHTQSEPASTWTFVHNLSTQYPNVTVYGSNNNIILPQSITATNANTLVLEFGTPVSGYATAGIGGTIEVNGRTIKQYFSSALEWRFEHNIGDRFVSIQTYDSGYEKIIPQTIALTDTTSSLITFPEATEGWAIGTIGGDLPSISSSYAGYVLQVSDSAPYTASWTAAANVTVTNALTASHLNPISQSLIPAVSGAYDLGSQSNPWKHIYVGTGSIYLVDNSGTIVKTLTGDSIVTNDNLSSLNAFTASNFTTNTFTSSTLARLDSIEIVSASNITRIDDIESFTSSTTARLNSLTNITGSLATTGSNTFFGTQTFSGSVYIKENLIVQGSSSLQNITASAVDIGTNRIILNVDNPSVRYAGISVYDSGSTQGTGSLWWDSLNNHWLYEHPSDSAAPYNSAILISGPKNAGNLGEELGLVNNYIVKSVGGDHISSSAIYDDGSNIKLFSNTEISGNLLLGVSKAGDDTDYTFKISRHGTLNNPGTYTANSAAIHILDYASEGPDSHSSTGLLTVALPRLNSTDTNAQNATLFKAVLDDMTAMQISGKGRTFIGQTSETDNGQILQVSGSSRFEGIGRFTSDLIVGGDFQLIGSNPRIDYPNNSSFRLYQTGVGTKFDVDGTNFTFYGTGVDSPKISLRGLNYVNAMIGDTTTGTSDIGNLWLYNDGTLKIRLDADNSGTSYINSNTFVVGATASSNAKFRVRHDATDATFTSKIQAVFGPSDYLDSDATDVFGGGTSETQFTNGNSSRPAMLSLGGSLNTAEALGVINFFRSGNTDNYRSRVQIWAGVQSTGTANQHGGYLEIRTANDGVAAPAALAQFEARGSFLLYRRDDNMTFADSVGALYVRTNGNHAANEEEFRIVGRNIGFFSHTGTRHAGINSSGILGIGYGGTPAATSKIFVSRGDQYGLHIDAQNGYARLQTTDDNLYLKVGSNDMISINSTSITLSSTVTASNVTTPNFAILETGVSKTVSGYNYDATQPMAMVITQTAQTTMGLMRASEDTTGATLRGMKARGNASTIASPSNGDDIFSVEGWAWHGSGPNYPKLGGGMKFVKDDNWGTASTRAPMRTEFYNANSTTTTQTTLIIYPSGNASLTGALTQNASDIRLKTNITKIENALEKINQLEGFTYNWNELSPMYNANTTTKEVGLSAQAVNEVLPEVVRLAPFDEDKLDGTNSKSGENYLTVQYEKLVPLLIEGIKELKQQNNSLQLQINELKNK